MSLNYEQHKALSSLRDLIERHEHDELLEEYYLLEEWIAEWIDGEAREEVYENGRSEGYDEGFQEGYDQGLEDARELNNDD